MLTTDDKLDYKFIVRLLVFDKRQDWNESKSSLPHQKVDVTKQALQRDLTKQQQL
jgi:hypothetical protein